MGIGEQDLAVILKIKQHYPHIKRCAILGDCSFHYPSGSKRHFQELLQLESVETFDVNGTPDHLVDLQEPLSPTFAEQFDLVLDIGTLYCVFDIAACWKNILFMLKTSGVVVHQSNLIGHFVNPHAH